MAQHPDHAYLVRCRAPMTPYANLATVSFPDVWLNGHNLFALFSFSHLANLLSELIARVQRHSPIKLVCVATDWAGRCATLPITGRTYSIVIDRWCQNITSGRIGVWNTHLLKVLGGGGGTTQKRLGKACLSSYWMGWCVSW